MDYRKLKRVPEKIQAALKEMPDGTVVAVKGCKIVIPSRFGERQLASLGAQNVIAGIHAIIVDDQFYGVSLVNAMMRIEPTTVSAVKFEDEEFTEFYFEPGSVVISNVNLVKSDTFTYYVYNEIVATGHTPWFMSYEDIGRLFETAPKHAGVRVGANHAVWEMIAAAISRDRNDKTKFYRHTVKSEKDLETNPPAFIPLRSVTYGATNTTAKFIGAYWDDALTSALVNPADAVEPIEALLRQ